MSELFCQLGLDPPPPPLPPPVIPGSSAVRHFVDVSEQSYLLT